MFADVNVESPKLIQPDITGASSAVPPLQTEATTEKVLYPLHHPFCYKIDSNLLTKIFLYTGTQSPSLELLFQS